MCKLNHKCPRKKKNEYYNLGAEEISKYDLKVENMKKKKTVLIGKKKTTKNFCMPNSTTKLKCQWQTGGNICNICIDKQSFTNQQGKDKYSNRKMQQALAGLA